MCACIEFVHSNEMHVQYVHCINITANLKNVELCLQSSGTCAWNMSYFVCGQCLLVLFLIILVVR